MLEEKIYDVSFVRHEGYVALNRILGMSIGTRALLRLERGEAIDKARIERYKQVVLEELGSNSNRYTLSAEQINGRWGLIIKRQT